MKKLLILLFITLTLLIQGCGSDDKSTRWYENGQKEFEGNYKDGKLDGKWTLWHENGQKSAEVNYKDGKEDGKWTWWYENGQK